MPIEIVEIDPDERRTWDAHVTRAPYRSLFHRDAALDVLAAHSESTLHRLVGYKGEEPVGVFPVFESRIGPVTSVRSPPDLFGPTPISLGPLRLNYQRCSQQRVDRDNDRFLRGCLEWIETMLSPDRITVTCGDRYTDVRPFFWSDFDFEITPLYTYLVDLDRDEDELQTAFTGEARRNMRLVRESTVDIRIGEREDVRRLVSQSNARYREKAVSFQLSTDFVTDLYDALGPETVRPYVCYDDGEFVGGALYLFGDDTVYAWAGGTAQDTVLPINDALDWVAMRDGAEQGLERFDFLGALAGGVHEYKSKFNPDPTPLFDVRWSSRKTNTVSRAYNLLPNPLASLLLKYRPTCSVRRAGRDPLRILLEADESLPTRYGSSSKPTSRSFSARESCLIAYSRRIAADRVSYVS